MTDLSKLIAPSARVALAAFLHDLGKFAERAKIDDPAKTVENNQQLYCPYHREGNWFSHKHAAWTAIALDRIEPSLPPLKGQDVAPFASWGTSNVDDSLINSAAKHHTPETFLQWVVATADRVASGFERNEFEEYNKSREKNHYTARQLTLFEQVRLSGNNNEEYKYDYRYRLKPLSPNALMPVRADQYVVASKNEAQEEYRELWNGFVEGVQKIPESHRKNLPLWLDHFETLWGCYTHAIPSATAFNTRPDVSLYDHSKATAALAVALWRYHHHQQDDEKEVVRKMRSRDDWDEEKLLLIQGDFSGIQKFIFESGGETRKYAAKLLRGRSFYVSLLTECAALKLLDRLGLPATSQILNAAGKFLIVAPNTEPVKTIIKYVQQELDEWFLEHRMGESSISLATLPACCNDFLKQRKGGTDTPFQALMEKLFVRLERAKLKRFDLCNQSPESAVFENFLEQFNEKGVCQIDGRSPATHVDSKDVSTSSLARDQIKVGAWLADDQRNRVVITREQSGPNTLQIRIFGYSVRFLQDHKMRQFNRTANPGDLLRAFDISLPVIGDTVLWNGYARRCINGYVPRFAQDDVQGSVKYKGLEDELETVEVGKVKSLNHIACEGSGVNALMVLKGDVDNLGLIFQKGLVRPGGEGNPSEGMTFAKMAALSRQMDAFFSIYLPWRCQKDFPDTYTVFAGGDDFFLIGPWYSQIRLAREMRQWFREYVTGNPEVHFSAGLSMTRPGQPIHYLAEQSEKALEKAKGHGAGNGQSSQKNAITCYGYDVSWDCFDELITKAEELEERTRQNKLSTGYLYGLLQFANMQADIDRKPENTIWHSRFAYRTKRLVERMKDLGDEEKREIHGRLAQEIAENGIRTHGENYKISLFTHLYKNREED